MRDLTANEMTNVNGGTCHYDPATEQALNRLYNELSSLGLLGSSIQVQAEKEITRRATYIKCD